MCVRAILGTFAQASGLTDHQRRQVCRQCLQYAAQRSSCLWSPRCSFPRIVANFPCRYRYLGIPGDGASISPTLMRRNWWTPLLPAFLYGSLVFSVMRVIKVTLSAIPVHVAIATCLSAWSNMFFFFFCLFPCPVCLGQRPPAVDTWRAWAGIYWRKMIHVNFDKYHKDSYEIWAVHVRACAHVVAFYFSRNPTQTDLKLLSLFCFRLN